MTVPHLNKKPWHEDKKHRGSGKGHSHSGMEPAKKPIKNFYFKIVRSNKSATGGRNQTAEVFKLKRGQVVKIGEVKWNTAAYKGDTSEVLEFLFDKKEISKKIYLARPDKYYSWTKGEEHNFKIQEL